MVISRRPDPLASTLQDWRCLQCRHLLMRVDFDALPAGVTLAEVKCSKCGRIAYLERPLTTAA